MTIDFVRLARIVEGLAEMAGTVGIHASVKRNEAEKLASLGGESPEAHAGLANCEERRMIATDRRPVHAGTREKGAGGGRFAGATVTST